MRLSSFVAVGALATFFGTVTESHAVVLDDFSTADPGNYNFVRAFGSGSPVFAVGEDATYFGSGSSTFQPTGMTGTTGVWLWNGGETLSNIGDSISIDIGRVNNGAVGLRISTSPTSVASSQEIALFTNTTTFTGVGGRIGASSRRQQQDGRYHAHRHEDRGVHLLRRSCWGRRDW